MLDTSSVVEYFFYLDHLRLFEACYADVLDAPSLPVGQDLTGVVLPRL